ncbi:uncharacterized protein LOC134227986 [Armigeres subalbatus]|uniref:uncharacterized protein LOC134227986 n=1 Tax=Armigeres subalbatus TaxID=124917 RepID=UPI002ED6AB7C
MALNRKGKAAQNGKSSKTIRNVLVQPFKVEWPCVDSEDAIKVIEMLNDLSSSQIVAGTNPVSHLLSQGQACALFITSDFHPQILGKQIIQMARRHSPHIQIIAPECLKYGGQLAKLVAIRNISNGEPKVIKLLTYITDIIKSKGYDKEQCELTSGTSKKSHEDPKTRSTSPVALSRLHLPRPGEGVRAFIPEVSAIVNEQTTNSKQDWGEYIALKRRRSEAKNDTENKKKSKPAATQKTSYISLTVNRIQGNPNRKKDRKNK